MIASIVGGFLNGIGTAINNNENYNNQVRLLKQQATYQERAQAAQNKANFELAQYQNQYNQEMWERQNEYNSPDATMKRLVEAGINPRAYQQIGQFANAGTPQPATPFEYKDPKLSSSEIRLRKLDIMNAFAERKLKYINLSTDILNSSLRLRETKRHNTAVENENIRYHDVMSNIIALRDKETGRHNLATEGEAYRHNRFNEEQAFTKLETDLLTNYGIRVYKPQGFGFESDNSVDTKASIGVIVPDYLYTLGKEKQLELLNKLKEEIEVLKHGNAWRAAFSILDKLADHFGIELDI